MRSEKGRLFSAKDAAEFLGMGERKLREVIARKEIAVIRNANGRLSGIYESACKDWQDAQEKPATARPRAIAQSVRIDRLMREMNGNDGHEFRGH